MNLIAFFSTFSSLKKYPKISGYLDRISKIWIMKKIDIQSIQVSMYPKKTDIHVSKYPCIHDIQVSTYPSIQLSKKNRYPRYPSIRISEKSGIRPSLTTFKLRNKRCSSFISKNKKLVLQVTYNSFSDMQSHYSREFMCNHLTYCT